MACIFDPEYRDSILQNYMETCLLNSVINVEGLYAFARNELVNEVYQSITFICNIHLGNLFGTLRLKA